MENNTPKRKSRLPLVILAVVLALGITAGVVFALMGGLDGAFKAGKSRAALGEATYAEGNAEVLCLAPVAEDASEEGLREYYAAAVEYAKANGLNTILYEGKSDITVFWRDDYFPSNELVTAKDTLFNKSFDPLAILLEAAGGGGVQVWLQMDPFTAEGYTTDMKGKVAELAGDGYALGPTTPSYTGLLAKSLAELPKSYPIAGIVFTNEGFNNPQLTEWLEPFASIAAGAKQAWESAGLATGLYIAQDARYTAFTGADIAKLQSEGTLDGALVTIGSEDVYEDMEEWAGVHSLVVNAKGSASEVYFVAAAYGSLGGAVLAEYPAAGDTGELELLRSAMAAPLREDGTADTLPAGFTISQELSVNYPSEGASISTEGLFIMGTSNPDERLYMNGEEVSRTSKRGAFGVYVELDYGESVFLFTNGNAERRLSVYRPEPTGGGGGTGGGASDGTQEAAAGQAVRMKDTIVSALADYANDGSMNETFPEGAVAVVEESIAATSNGLSSWVYKLESGDYVWADKTEWVDTGTFHFTGLSAESHEYGEYLLFEGSGTPAAYISYDEVNIALELTMYSTSFTGVEGFGSEFVKSASVSENEDGSITLKLSLNRIWGYSLEYEGGSTKLFLKRVPTQSNTAAKPLEGVRVLLDPGHGDNEPGALGVMGLEGPNEKDLNLALAQTIAYRLRQLGATVLMTREDDTFLTLNERLYLQTELKPDVFLSVHHNSNNLNVDINNMIPGSQVFYYHPYSTPNSKKLATALQENILSATGRNDREVGWGYYYVTRTTVCPSVLYEYGFIVHPAEFEDIVSTEGRTRAALATADAILEIIPAE